MYPSYLVVGLGNPGLRYRRTRHNIGFMAAEAFARSEGGRFRRTDTSYRTAELASGNEGVRVVKPMRYMNASGRVLRQIVQADGLSLEKVLVLCDDLNLPVGKLRLRRGGSDGGHRGLASIIDAVGTDAFPRLRFGVGRPENDEVIDYVLSRFARHERMAVRRMIEAGGHAIRDFIRYGIDQAMNRVNAGLPAA